MKILVGSTNPVKINSVREAFSKYYSDIEVKGLKVNSGMPSQPIGEETFIGAENRAKECKKINDEKNLNFDFFVGIEGGIENKHNRWFCYGVVCIIDKNGKKGFGTSLWYPLPEEVMNKILNEKIGLGSAMDELEHSKNIKQKNGAVGILTNNKITRTDINVQGIIGAMIPFIKKDLLF